MSTNYRKLLCLYIPLFSLCMLLSGCETYRSSFGETYIEANSQQGIYRLDLSNQQLNTLSQIQLSSAIRMLDISGNPQLNLTETLERICQLPHLRILKLNRMQIQNMPDSLANCKQLTQLSLTHNPTLDLSQTIDVIKELPLVFLDLSYNQLRELPTNLSQLHLRDIRLTGNQLGNAADLTILSKANNLYTIWLDNNAIHELPSEVGLLSKIGYLYLDNNALKTLPSEMVNMQRLGGIWLGNNCFSEIPPVLASAGILMAYLDNNQITHIDEAFYADTITLRGIVLDYNYLTTAQTQITKQLFKHTFIYSAANQYPLPVAHSCLWEGE